MTIMEEIIEDKGHISDGYHTFNELYEYRLLYNAAMFNELAKQNLYDVHKSRRHSDGTIPFGDENWFIDFIMLTKEKIQTYKVIEQEIGLLVLSYYENFIKQDDGYVLRNWNLTNDIDKIDIVYSYISDNYEIIYENKTVTINDLNE